MSRTLTIKLQGLRRMLDKRPHDGRVWLQIAETLLELERDEEARDAAQNAFRHADDDEARSSAEALLLGLGDEPPAPVLATATPAPGDDSKDEPAPSNLRVLRGGKAGTPDDAPDATATLETIGFEDVGGLDEVKDQIRMKIVLPFQKPDVFRAFGKKRGGGILLYGPPGCGKTLLARATAGECRATFMNVAINEVLDMWFGQSEQKLAALFEEARRRAPTVLFFDEVEAIGASRQQLRHSPGKTLVIVLLSEMDGVSRSNDRVLVMAATNAPWHVDPALLRPGRFDRVQFIPTPDEGARRAILALHLADRPTAADVNIEKLAKKTPDFSGADLADLVERGTEAPLREALVGGEMRPIRQRDLQQALAKSRPSTRDWFQTAKNYATFANVGGLYDDLTAFLERR